MYKESKIKEIQGKFQILATQLKGKYFERSVVIDGILSALLSKQHVFLIGPPGTAKSAILTDTINAIGGTFFQTLLTRFTVPEEVFGAIKLSGLQQDKYSRKIDGKLPTANIAFLDEVFKANSAILNSILTIMNERIFFDDGLPVKVPLFSMVLASNELPESEELGAMFDRIAISFEVQYMREESNVRKMMFGSTPDVTVQLSLQELEIAVQATSQLPWEPATIDCFFEIKRELAKAGFVIGDRRLKFIKALLQAYAWLQGDSVVSDDHVSEMLGHMVWKKPEELKKIESIISKVGNPTSNKALMILDAVKAAYGKLESNPEDGNQEDKKTFVQDAGMFLVDIGEQQNKLQKLIDENPRKAGKAKSVFNEVSTLGLQVGRSLNDLLKVRGGGQ